MAASNEKSIAKVVVPMETSDGDGVKLYRGIGGPKIDSLDPFLLLDEFKSDDPNAYIGGFPDHPHRGFSTVTYMLAGRMEHHDHTGNRGNLVPGSVQWMTAGRGIVHSEMPKQEAGLMWGFQLWVNLPKVSKMCPPNYQDIPPESIPIVTTDDGIKVKVIAGDYKQTHGPVKDVGGSVFPIYFDVTIPAGKAFTYDFPDTHNLFSYVFEGKANISGQTLPASRLIIYNFGGKTVTVTAPADTHARLLFVAGKPLNEPIARYGPFVMNTRDEILQAFMDYQSGQLQKKPDADD